MLMLVLTSGVLILGLGIRRNFLYLVCANFVQNYVIKPNINLVDQSLHKTRINKNYLCLLNYHQLLHFRYITMPYQCVQTFYSILYM